MAAAADPGVQLIPGESLGKMKQRHKMELKKCQQDGKALLKNKKMPKKEARAQAEALEAETTARHAKELAALELATAGPSLSDSKDEAASEDAGKPSTSADDDAAAIAAKKSRAQERRMKKKREKDARRKAIEEEKANTVDPRVTETAAINAKLGAFGLQVFDVPADGNCLFRAVVHELHRSTDHTDAQAAMKH